MRPPFFSAPIEMNFKKMHNFLHLIKFVKWNLLTQFFTLRLQLIQSFAQTKKEKLSLLLSTKEVDYNEQTISHAINDN